MYTRELSSHKPLPRYALIDFELTMKAKQNPSTSSLEENLDT